MLLMLTNKSLGILGNIQLKNHKNFLTCSWPPSSWAVGTTDFFSAQFGRCKWPLLITPGWVEAKVGRWIVFAVPGCSLQISNLIQLQISSISFGWFTITRTTEQELHKFRLQAALNKHYQRSNCIKGQCKSFQLGWNGQSIIKEL